MRSEREIRNRISFLLSEELVSRIESSEKRVPRGCRFNHRQPLDVRKTIDGEANPRYNCVSQSEKSRLPVQQTIGLCMYGSDGDAWTGDICEDEIDAKRCGKFEPQQTKEEIREGFLRDIRDPGWMSSNMAEVSTLLWVLELMSVSTLPWWLWLWYRFRRVSIEPQVEVASVIHLLPDAVGSGNGVEEHI